MGRIAEEEREKLHVRLDKIEQIFYINSGDFIPKSRNYECTNGAQTIAVWAFLIYCLFLGIINCPDRVVPKKQSDPDNYLRMKNYHSY